MRRTLALLLLTAVLLTAAALFPRFRHSPQPVYHQHLNAPGEPASGTGFQEDGSLTSHLPLIILHTEGRTVPGELRSDLGELHCSYSVIDNPQGLNNSQDTPALQGLVKLSIRGNTSRKLPKKQFTMKLVDDEGFPQDAPMLGMPAESIWVLNGSYIDHSQLRNYMLYNLSDEILGYVPRVRLCEVMTTDAHGNTEYQGVYTLIEKIKVSENRLNLPEYDPRISETSFLVQMNTYNDPTHFTHLSPDNYFPHNLDLEYPDLEEITPESWDYIQQQLILLDRRLYDAIHTHDWFFLNQKMDVDSFVDYFLINEFFQNYDAGSISTYLCQSPGGKIQIGPVWDFDGCFNNFSKKFTVDELGMQSSFYYYYLTQSPEFAELCIRRYEQLRSTYLSEAYLLSYIDSASAYLGTAALRNSELWYENGAREFYDDVAAMKQFVVERGAWMDENFERLTRVPE